MPTYEYICEACGNNWEAEQRIIEPALKDCPKCGKDAAKRQISSGGTFILKGGGWYADLYSSKKSSSDATSTSSKGTTSTAASTESKAEPAKPAAPPASPAPSGPSTGSSSGSSVGQAA